MPSPRDHSLSAIDMQEVRRIPFWPKLDGAYAQAQQEPFRRMTIDDLHDWVGSDRHAGTANCIREVRHNTSLKRSRDNGVGMVCYHTPSGTLTARNGFDLASASWHPVEFPVKTPGDIAAMTEWFLDQASELDHEALNREKQRMQAPGTLAVHATGIGISPLMDWLQHLAGVENGHLWLMSHRSDVERLFGAMHGVLCARARLIAEHVPADLVYMIENTSTTLLSPDQYRRYCLPFLLEYADILKAHSRRLVLHMCGHLRQILPDIAQVGASAFEAFTTPPVGDTSLLDGRSACPTTCLIGGTNAALWLRPAEEIISEIKRQLDALPHHRGIVITSGGVMPPLCPPETIRAVCEWVQSYAARN